MIKKTVLYAITSLFLLISFSSNEVNASNRYVTASSHIEDGFVRVEQVRNEIERSSFQMGDLGTSKPFNEGVNKVETEQYLRKLAYREIKVILDELLAVENPTVSDENHLVLTMKIVVKRHLDSSSKDNVETLVKESNYSQSVKNKIGSLYPQEDEVVVKKPALKQSKPRSRFFLRNLINLIGWGSIIIFLLITFSSFRINKDLPDDFDLDKFVDDDDKEKEKEKEEDKQDEDEED